jgi:hypothetical protein
MKRLMFILAVAAMSVVFVFAVVNATQECPDTITMDSNVFPTHSKGLVTFSHKKHNADYKVPCTECHHVYADGKNTWKQGDAVQECDACHSEAKAPAGAKMSKEEKIQKYYYSAIHENCLGCHKALKKEGKPTGPTSCKGCHPAK